MTQLYATGSAEILGAKTITVLVTTPVEPSLWLFVGGIITAALLIVFIEWMYTTFDKVRMKNERKYGKD